MSGIASSFTREFFEISAFGVLAPGECCPMGASYDISDTDLRIDFRRDVSLGLPNGSLWLIGKGDVLLIGSTAPGDDS